MLGNSQLNSFRPRLFAGEKETGSKERRSIVDATCAKSSRGKKNFFLANGEEGQLGPLVREEEKDL